MKKSWVIVVVFAFVLQACKKDDPPVAPSSPGKYDNGLLLLNEGLYQQNNASLCFYSLTDHTVYIQSFFSENARGLGDTANDFEKYTIDGKEYIIVAVDVSSQLEIIEANTLKSVAQIPVFDGAQAREPRRIKIYGTRAFICNFDGTVVVVDLATNSIIETIAVGDNPDGLAAINNKLYVSNSGGLNYPVYDSTISVINMDTYMVEGTIPTRINCNTMIADAQGEIYLLSSGNYTTVPPALLRINTVTNEVIDEYLVPIRAMAKVADWIYYYDEQAMAIMRFNTLDETFEGIEIIDCSAYETFYGMQYNNELGLLFCYDANGYVNAATVRAYGYDGQFEFEVTAELNAKKIIYND
jgi:YVTN family beta-propeller protein